MYEIHISDVRTFKTCRRKWNWSSPLRRNLEPEIPYAPFFTGRAIHQSLEDQYTDGIPFKESFASFLQHERIEMERIGRLWPQEEQTLFEQVLLIQGMLEHYDLWRKSYKGRWSDDQFHFIAMETEFKVPLYNRRGRKSTKVYLAGRFDGLIMRKDDGTRWIWETKTTRSIDELTKSLANDEQCGAYIYAAEELFGLPVQGVLYNLMRKKSPTKPHITQTGYLSKNKSIDTTAEHYLATIRETHPDWSNADIEDIYGDILQILLDKGNTFFARVPVYRTEKEIDQLSEDLWSVALEMTRPSTRLYPTPSWLNCNFCHFRGACLAYNAGADYEFILSQEFRRRVPYNELLYAADKEENNGG